ncbi:hypothetical protein [Yoonia rosea]|uniref:hypothetical protein n=1 Tax=Yoonia rosea TaxID=287098 RepID=UPI001A97AC6A|nr:hypothetical protein [Yoonia rosea]
MEGFDSHPGIKQADILSGVPAVYGYLYALAASDSMVILHRVQASPGLLRFFFQSGFFLTVIIVNRRGDQKQRNHAQQNIGRANGRRGGRRFGWCRFGDFG